MDVLLDADERQIVDQTRAFLEGACPPSLVRSAETQGNFAPPLWRQALELGWLDTCLPESLGGLGLPLPTLALLCEEVGRHLAPLPLLSVMVPLLTLARHAPAEHRAVIDAVRRGERLLSFAFQEPDGAWAPDAIRMQGRLDGDALVLNGRKAFADNAAHAQQCLVAFRLEGTPGGLALALVDTDSAGLTRTALVPTAKDAQSTLHFADVRVPRSRLVGPAGGADALVREAMDHASLFTASLMAGAARRTLEMAVSYVSGRMAFEQPIGSFQAIQHLCADLLIGIDGVDLLSHEAAWKLSQGFDAGAEVSAAKAFANDKCVLACRSAQQMHGGMGFMMEFDLQLWYRRIVSWSLRCGTTAEHRRRVAGQVLGRKGHWRLDGRPVP